MTVKSNILMIQELASRPTYVWLAYTIIDWSIILLSVSLAVYAANPIAYIFAVAVVGNRQHAIAVLGHEGAHYTIHKSRKVNDLLSDIFCFWPLLITTEGYRALHFKHHRHTGTKDDPELMHKAARSPQWNLPLKPRRVLGYLLKDIFGYSLPDLAIILTFSRPEKLRKLIPVAALHIAFVLAFSQISWVFPVVWYASLATTFMCFFRIRLWLEHQGTFDTQRVHVPRLLAAIFAPHNIWLHWEHHKWPTLPFVALKKARSRVAEPKVMSLAMLKEVYLSSPEMRSGATKDDDNTDVIPESLPKAA